LFHQVSEEEEEEESYLRKNMFVRCPLPRLYPCTLPTAPVSRSFGLRSSYEIYILDTDQRPRNNHSLLIESLRSTSAYLPLLLTKLAVAKFCHQSVRLRGTDTPLTPTPIGGLKSGPVLHCPTTN
jgi:hypothetical protein